MDTRLAYETLSQILSYLKEDQSALVQINRTCKKLYEVSLPLLFKSPKFETFSCFESFATTLTETNGLFVRNIDLHMVPHRWDSFRINNLLFTLSEKTPNLELLNLDLCSQLTNKALIKITKPLHDLRILSVDQCELIGDESIEALVNNCPYIQELYLGSTHITDNSLNLIATKFILLTHLHLPGCEYISEIGVDKVTSECKTLRYIDLQDCYNVLGERTFQQDTLSGANARPDIPLIFEDDQWEDIDEDDEEEGEEAELEQGEEMWEDAPPAYRAID
ncbi:conserved hypothetical protein [Mucor ambiguus]|uniref:F-box domain-containing protein n=1 Tax=Mucor ambiguus TaxID=91626 RepID=A0A0C9M7Q7_9FUNG|nr:conserved hypothetical protein [Mucor ambiguus]